MKVCTREIEYVCVHSLISHPHQDKAYECDLRNTSTSSKYVVNTQPEQLVQQWVVQLVHLKQLMSR